MKSFGKQFVPVWCEGISRRNGLIVFMILPVLSLVLMGCSDKKRESDGAGFEVETEYQRGPLRVIQRLSKSEIVLSDVLILELEADIESGYEVEMPSLESDLGKFHVLDWEDGGNHFGEKGRMVHTIQYRLEPLEPGQWWLDAFAFTYRAEGKAEEESTIVDRTLTTEPVKITVTSLIAEQGGELTISDIEGVVSVPRRYSWVWIMVGLCGLFAGVGLIIWRWSRWRMATGAKRELRSAHEIAYERLRVLLAEQLIESGHFKEFTERISGILRHYIEDRFGLRAPERTTEEFLVEVKAAKVFEDRTRDDLARFMEHCDLVKFARYPSGTEQMNESLELVRTFIDRSKSELCKIDVKTGQRIMETEAV
ncbi:MAG: hypothetical protein JXA82_08760 [Sedimentisphaerales bacterium]|nr:hypothetical protein [Sedimentisphaerales bacterium]